MRITLDALETLEAVVTEGSFAGAARRLHKVQSAVSYGIKQLEEALGVPLFDRSGHRARLTPEGEALLAESRGLLDRARHLETLAQAWSTGWEARLSVVVDGVLPLGPVFDAVRTLEREGAPTRIEVQMATLGGVQRRFAESDADLMIAKEFSPAAGLIAQSLAPIDMLLVVGASHPLAEDGCVDDAALKHHRELLVYDSGAARPEASRHAIGGTLRFFLADFHAKREALLAGLGYGWMPAHLVAEALADGRLAPLERTGGARFSFTPQLVRRLDRPPGRAGRRFVELVAG